MKILRAVLFSVSLVLIIWLLAPLYKGVVHIGMIYPLPVLVAVMYFSSNPDKLNKLFADFKPLMITLSCLVGVGAIFVTSVIGVCVGYALNSPEKNQTVIILGCQVNGETPSLMLYDRMNKAVEYLEENPESCVVVSGGKGPGESITEAEAMKRYLIEKGISESRIFTEEKSVNTKENIAFSAKIIKENGLNPSVAIATDGFHQFRAHRFCRENNIENTALSCNTRWYFNLSYYSREVLAVIKMIIF